MRRFTLGMFSSGVDHLMTLMASIDSKCVDDDALAVQGGSYSAEKRVSYFVGGLNSLPQPAQGQSISFNNQSRMSP